MERPVIRCEASIQQISSFAIVRIPSAASKALSSRAMVMIEGTLNHLNFLTPVEPDGKGSHWFYLPEAMLAKGSWKTGDTIYLEFQQTDNWPEPVLPPDLEADLTRDSDIWLQWQKLSSKAKWEWLRWIRSAVNSNTRTKRIKLVTDKLQMGHKNPCCFNSTMCTDLTVCKNGILLDIH